MRVLLFDIDTLRADHMGCYGYGRNTTPVMDEIAKEGVRFDDYYCPNAPCLPSRASMISGQYGIHNGIVGHGGTAADMRLQGNATRSPAATHPFIINMLPKSKTDTYIAPSKAWVVALKTAIR